MSKNLYDCCALYIFVIDFIQANTAIFLLFYAVFTPMNLVHIECKTSHFFITRYVFFCNKMYFYLFNKLCTCNPSSKYLLYIFTNVAFALQHQETIWVQYVGYYRLISCTYTICL